MQGTGERTLQYVNRNRLGASFQNELPALQLAQVKTRLGIGILADQDLARPSIGCQPGDNIYSIPQSGNIRNPILGSNRPDKGLSGMHSDAHGYPWPFRVSMTGCLQDLQSCLNCYPGMFGAHQPRDVISAYLVSSQLSDFRIWQPIRLQFKRRLHFKRRLQFKRRCSKQNSEVG